jgi:hypothetical protein
LAKCKELWVKLALITPWEIERREEGGGRREEGEGKREEVRERRDGSPVHLQRRSADRQRPGLTTERGKERKEVRKEKRRKAIEETGVQFTSSAVPQFTSGWLGLTTERGKEVKKGRKEGN